MDLARNWPFNPPCRKQDRVPGLLQTGVSDICPYELCRAGCECVSERGRVHVCERLYACERARLQECVSMCMRTSVCA